MVQWVKCLPLKHGNLRSQTWPCTPVAITLAGGRRCRNSRTPKDIWPESPATQLVPGLLRDLFSKDKEETNIKGYLTLTSVYHTHTHQFIHTYTHTCAHMHTKYIGNFFFKKFDHGN